MDKLKITILYDAKEDKDKAEAVAKGEKFPLVYEQVSQVLTKRGHQVKLLAAERKIRNLVGQIDKDDSDMIFNLCEAIDGVSQHESNVASLLELLERKFTGSGAMGLTLAQNKALAKKLFQFHGIKFPKFSTINKGQVDWSDNLKFPLIVKPLNEDASIGITYKSIVHNVKELMERISYIHTEIKTPALIEEFIEGREIYIGVLGNDKPQALPLVEWDFSKLSEGIPKIASAEAKWDKDSEGFNSPVIFPEDIPEEVYVKMQEVAVEAFKALELHEYGRVDIRLRQKNRPKALPTDPIRPEDWEYYIIEVNPNPYLDRKAEFAMAARKVGLSYPELIERIIDLALARYGRLA